MPKISIKPEILFSILSFPVTNSLLLSEIVLIIFFVLALKYFSDGKKESKTGFYYFFNFIVKSIYTLFESVMGEKAGYFFPLLFSFFMFIILQNWFGLIPGVGSVLYRDIPVLRGGNADLNSTFALAIISVGLIQFFGIKYLGLKGYLGKFLNFTNPINFFLGILEILSEFSRIISFSFRLFGNIFAGEVLLTIVAFLVPVLASFPFIILELFVGFIQALVFSMLTAVFINGAIASHHS